MTTFDELAGRYIAIWNETDPRQRRAAIDELWTADARYVDPLGVAEGREEIDRLVAAVQDQFPGMLFRLVGPVDGHHDQLRFTWELGQAGAEAPVVGFDVAVTDGDGRLRQVLGFLDRVPAGGPDADR
ncbi:nuclear transport factor 2 family protein [Micromonospora costi]|uniref:Nuclear transport factor 2 family protein n=1 Tax=Micromonospora costi TaxID=1530042 RepID=A0A3B0AAN1_9ACTN|nr:nuclear transport factor 2 family protein [Micromonospora costi]RKN57559.1 nuclear transport factor 2 family protein [Micromonospora costi]